MAFTRLEPTGVNTSATFTFANANVTTNLNVGGVSNLGPVGNIIITGGTSGYVLSTDGSGTLSWVAQSGGGGTNYSNANVAAYLPTFTGNFTAGNISTTGNITAAYFIGNGSTLTSINGANVSGQVSFAATANSVAGGNVSGQVANALVAGTVYTNAQPNITSLGTLANLTVSGVSNLGYNQVGEVLKLSNSASAADKWLTFKNLYGEFQIGTQGNTGAYLYNFSNSPIDFYTGAVKYFSIANTGATQVLSTTDASSKTTGALQVSGGVGITGNVYANYYFGNADSLSGTIANANYATFAGTVITNAQPNITSVGTLVSLDVTANVSSGNILTNNLLYANGVAWSFGSTYSNTNVAAYLPTYAGTLGADTLTAPGHISGLNLQVTNSSGDEGGEILLAKPQTNSSIAGTGVTIDVYQNKLRFFEQGGTARGGFLDITALGAGASTNLLSGGSTTNPAGANTQIQFNNLGSFGADANFTYDIGTDTLGVKNVTMESTGALSGGNSISATYVIGNGSLLTSITGGNVSGQVGNALVAGTVYTNAQPNITSVGTLTSVTISGLTTATGGVRTGNIQDTSGTNTISVSSTTVGVIGNLTVGTGGAGNATATYFIGNGSTLTSITGGNVTGQVGNALVAATVYTNAQPNITSVGTLSALSVSGNISTGNLLTDNLLYANGVAWSFGGGSSYSNANVAAYLPTYTGNVSANYFIGNALSVGSGSGGTISGANSITSNYISVATSLSLTGTSTFALSSDRTTYVSTSTSGTYTADTSAAGPVWYFTTIAGATTLNFTNLPTTDGYTSVLVAMFASTATVPAVQIAGSAQTIKWISGAAPTGNASGINIYTFSCVRVNSAWTAVLGSYSYYA